MHEYMHDVYIFPFAFSWDLVAGLAQEHGKSGPHTGANGVVAKLLCFIRVSFLSGWRATSITTSPGRWSEIVKLWTHRLVRAQMKIEGIGGGISGWPTWIEKLEYADLLFCWAREIECEIDIDIDVYSVIPLLAALIQTLSQTNSLGVRMHLCPCDQMRMQLGGLLDMFGDHHAGAFELRSAKLLRVFRVFCRPANARKAITA